MAPDQQPLGDRLSGLTMATLLAGFCGLAFALYGFHLGEGLLADDYLYANWLDQGLGELLRRLSIASDPRIIRPLPALGWLLGSLPGGALMQHATSVLLHALCAVLVARLAERSRPGSGLPAALLFLTFPLFAEPVIWLSAAFDLWAAFFALAALEVGLGSTTPRRRLAAASLFALSLLSKESTLLLPLLPLFLVDAAPPTVRRRLAVDLALVAAAYLLLRFVLFGGPGGYLDSAGHSLAWHLDVWRFLRNALLQVPYRLLMPLKRAGELAPLLALASTALGGLLLAAAKPWRKPRYALLTLGTFLVALAPTAPVFGIDFDHENSRMLYFPVAMLCVVAPSSWRLPAPRLHTAVYALALYWGALSMANGVSWSQASRELHGTLAALEERQQDFPAAATVFVAGHDTWHGAYAWRNALYLATRRAGLRQDITWRLGTIAMLGPPEGLGEKLFELEAHPRAPLRDLTLCQRTLHLETPLPLARVSLQTLQPRHDALGLGGRLDLPPLALPTPSVAPAVVISTAGPLTEAITGRLFWRFPGVDRFNVTEARRFHLAAGGQQRTVVRLAPPSAPLHRLDLRLETDRAEALGQLTEVQVVEGGEPCRPSQG